MKAKTPAVSIIVPMYRVGKYITYCVDSVLEQSFADWELILVDDVSPDRTYEICKEQYGKEDRIKILCHEKNEGSGPARNTGLSAAVGKYIYFLDGDDELLPNAIQKMLDIAENAEAEIVHTHCWYDCQSGEHLLSNSVSWKKSTEQFQQTGWLEGDLKQRLHNQQWGMQPMPWTNLYRRDFLVRHNLQFPAMRSEDDVFSMATVLLAKRFYCTDFAFNLHRIHSESISNFVYEDKMKQDINVLLTGTTYLKDLFSRFSYDELPFEARRDTVIDWVFAKIVQRIFSQDREGNEQLDIALSRVLQPYFSENTVLIKSLLHLVNSDELSLVRIKQKLDDKLVRIKEKKLINTTIEKKIQMEIPNMLTIVNKLKKSRKRVLFLGTPLHGNIGEHAAVLGELSILEELFPSYEIIEIPLLYLLSPISDKFSSFGYEKAINDDDLIFIHGGRMGNVWPIDEQVRRQIVVTFSSNQLIFFPQTVFFTDDEIGKKELVKSKSIYGKHDKLLLLCREEKSCIQAKKMVAEEKVFLAPDAGLSLLSIATEEKSIRQGCVFLLRGSKEKANIAKYISFLMSNLQQKNIAVELKDTVIEKDISAESRLDEVARFLRYLRSKSLVVTDRLQGVHLALAAGTPVLALPSFSYKIPAAMDWLKEIDAVKYMPSLSNDEVMSFMDKQVDRENPIICKRPYRQLLLEIIKKKLNTVR